MELLSPVGDFKCLKAAVQNGCDAVYLGASSFSARSRATNFDLSELKEAIKYAKLRNVKVHLALNTLIKNDEFGSAVKLAVTAYNLGVDAIIIQDLGLASFLKTNYPEIPLHASTQMTVHNLDGVKQLEKLGFSRVVLARELSFDEIKYIKEHTSIELEVFIHGALCISYSGQCLISSMIGGRSGNRGDCAQPCRLPYSLYENNNLLDKGYLLSPRDNFGVQFLPELINAGIDSFKIEGRMKTPEYVGVVTKFYRKYINLVSNYLKGNSQSASTSKISNFQNPEFLKKLRELIDTNLNAKNSEAKLTDYEEISQVFNRGGFSTGHFDSNPNQNLIFKEKPNNMGIYLGKIIGINQNKGHLKLKLENDLSIGDRISINDETYTVSELMIGNDNFKTMEAGKEVTIGRMKGNIKEGFKIYRISSSALSKAISPTFEEPKEFKKIPLCGEIIIKENTPITLKIWSDFGIYKGVEFTAISEVIPQKALNQPISKEKIYEQLTKTGNTCFEFKNLNILLTDNLFLPIKALNEVKRDAIQGLENSIIQSFTRNLKLKPIPSFEKTSVNKNSSIALLLNIFKPNFEYEKLEVSKLYIPLIYFINSDFKNRLIDLSQKIDLYVYMPNILKDSKINSINFEEIIKSFNIKGFVVSHISQLERLKKFNLELIGNFTLNIYNNFGVEFLKSFGISTFTPSVELSEETLNEVLNLSNNIISEVIIYGKIPVMTNNYCYLGCSNKCYKNCKKKCKSDSIFYLKDRLNYDFRIIPNPTFGTTTIFNSRPIKLSSKNINANYFRVDILDEDFKEIKKILQKI